MCGSRVTKLYSKGYTSQQYNYSSGYQPDTLSQDIDMQEIKISKVTHTHVATGTCNLHVHVGSYLLSNYMQPMLPHSCSQYRFSWFYPYSMPLLATQWQAGGRVADKLHIVTTNAAHAQLRRHISQKTVPTNNTTSNQSWWVSWNGRIGTKWGWF